MVKKLPERFGHLLAFHLQEAVVHPDLGQRMIVMGAFALGDLVLVMGKHQIDAAAMDVEGLAQIFARHGRAFDVPAGTAAAPGRIPARRARRPKASTARNPSRPSCRAPLPPARRRSSRPASGATACRNRAWRRHRTAHGRLEPHRHARPRSAASIIATIWAICSVARGVTRGRQAAQRRHILGIDAARFLRSVRGWRCRARRPRALILSSTSVMLRT